MMTNHHRDCMVKALLALGFTYSTETASDGPWLDCYHPDLRLSVSLIPSESGEPAWRVNAGAGATLREAATEALQRQAEVAAFDLVHSFGAELKRIAAMHSAVMRVLSALISLEATL